jgi:hypothetical protein
MGGDISGDQTNSKVVAIQGHAVTTTAPTTGQVLKWDGISWGPAADTDTNTVATGGDLNGAQTSATVVALQGRGVASTAPTTGQVLKWNGTAWAPAADTDTDTTGIISESDPEVGANSLNYVSKWNGSSLVTSSIFDNGNVGIGTNAPNANNGFNRLTVAASDPTALAVGIENAGAGQAGLILQRTGSIPARWYQYVPAGSTDLRFYNGSDLLTISSSGNVGIGTSTPAAKLEVSGSVNVNGKISGVATPTASTDAANKAYVDSVVSGSAATQSWTNVTSFGSCWTNYGNGYQTVQYKKVGDMVYLRGTIYDSSWTLSTCNPVLTLPAGFRPQRTVTFYQSGAGGGQTLQITNNGIVTRTSGVCDSCWNVEISLDGIVFGTD